MILDDIVADKRQQLIRDKKHIDLPAMRRLAEERQGKGTGAKASFYRELARPGLSVIGEFKQASPSLGNITSRIDLPQRIAEYSQSVEAISCLTEEAHFHGNVDYFRQIRGMTELPMIRKDFMIDEYQFYEAKAIRADAVLLIAAILDDARLKDFYQLSRELELDVLVEVHDREEMERALRLDCRIIGINNRNLKDFTISLERTADLARMVPEDKVLVAESGIVTEEDVAYLAEHRVDAFLIGRAFMEHEHPQELAARWKEVFARAAGHGSCRE